MDYIKNVFENAFSIGNRKLRNSWWTQLTFFAILSKKKG